MASFHQPTVQLLRYRLKRQPAIVTIRIATLEIVTSIRWCNTRGEPTDWLVALFINSDEIGFVIHELTDWHEFVTMSLADFQALEG